MYRTFAYFCWKETKAELQSFCWFVLIVLIFCAFPWLMSFDRWSSLTSFLWLHSAGKASGKLEVKNHLQERGRNEWHVFAFLCLNWNSMSCHHCFDDNSSISKAIVVELYANSSSPEQLEVALVAECPLGRGYETLQLEAHRIDIVGYGHGNLRGW